MSRWAPRWFSRFPVGKIKIQTSTHSNWNHEPWNFKSHISTTLLRFSHPCSPYFCLRAHIEPSPHTVTNSPPPFLPWASRWPPRWPGWRCGRGGWRWTRRDWTGPRARVRDSFLSWHWTLRRDHPFDWQPGDCSQNSCNRTGLPEREASHGKWAKERRKEGRTDGRTEGRKQTPGS